MKTNKIIKLCALLLMLAMLLAACGEKSTDSTSAPADASVGSDVTVDDAPSLAEDFNIEKWGAYYELYAETGKGEPMYYSVRYPSRFVPSDKFTGISQNEEDVYTMVSAGGQDYRAESVEDVLNANMGSADEYSSIIGKMVSDRKFWHDEDMCFQIETQKAVTINDFPACKFTGVYTFTREGEAFEAPFVAYTMNLKEDAEGYIYIFAIDESRIENNGFGPLGDGVLEDYAYKMALSVKLRK